MKYNCLLCNFKCDKNRDMIKHQKTHSQKSVKLQIIKRDVKNQ